MQRAAGTANGFPYAPNLADYYITPTTNLVKLLLLATGGTK